MNIYQYTYDIVKQIPKGHVSTYGAVAKALGDIRASRAVGRMMNQNPNPDEMPCYKIVYSDGRIGGFDLGIREKIYRLAKDNIQINNGRIVDFEHKFFDDFKTSYPLQRCREQQVQLRNMLTFQDHFDKSDISTVAGFDVAYPKNDFQKACIACVVIDYKTKKIIETKTHFQQTSFPYIPTYLAFRELPLIQQVYQKLENDPSVLMFDGNGILHPFRFGLACHAGIHLNKPSIGVAKRRLCGTQQKDNMIVFENQILGKALYTHKQVKNPVYVSPGHHITLTTAFSIAVKTSTHKHPRPVRHAHLLARETIKDP
ncbi:MAG: endonuclease V [Candidatus Thermoplasmatota archaeon]|nr:endonuclease V [Candidatus Thermoplasmatota archaeon]